jgi:hypothetical protein
MSGLPNLPNFDSDREEHYSIVKLRKSDLVDQCEVPGSFDFVARQQFLEHLIARMRKFIFQVKSLTSLSLSLPPWHLPRTLDLTYPAGGTA